MTTEELVPISITAEEIIVPEEAAVAVVEHGRGRGRRERTEPTREEIVDKWTPKTKIGKLVKAKEIKSIDELLDHHKILESEIVDALLDLKKDLLMIGQMKGKFGGGKRAWRKQTQKKTAEGNVTTFSIMAKVDGKCGSATVVLMPAPQGTGLVACDELKKILRLAGIKDVYSKTFGKTKTTTNLAKACLDALKKTSKIQMQE